jgi:hypothetical protein
MHTNCCDSLNACFADNECAGLNQCISRFCLNATTSTELTNCVMQNCPACDTQAAVTLFTAIQTCAGTYCVATDGGGC